jgi:hypothetical protein
VHLASFGKSRLSFDDDFTLEGFFRTDGDHISSGAMTILQLDDSSTSSAISSSSTGGFCYALDLNVGTPGSFRFAIGPEVSAGVVPSVVLDNRNYADGNWYYFVARYNRAATGAGSRGVLTVKVRGGPYDAVAVGTSRGLSLGE